MAGIEVCYKRRAGNRRFVREEAGHTNPCRIGTYCRVRGLNARIRCSVDIEILLNLVEVCPRRGKTKRRIRAVQRERNLHPAVCVKKEVIPKTGFHAVLLHIQTRECIERAASDGIHCGNSRGNLAIIPVIVHKELIHPVNAVLIRLHPRFIAAVNRVLIRNAAGRNHGIVPTDEHIRALFVHVPHHGI